MTEQEVRRWVGGAVRLTLDDGRVLAGTLHVELGPQGIKAYNLHPGFVFTERLAADMGEFGFDASQGAPPDVVGAVAAWLVTTAEGRVPSHAARSVFTSTCVPSRSSRRNSPNTPNASAKASCLWIDS